MADLATTVDAPHSGASLLDRKKKMPSWISGVIVLVALVGGLGYIGFHVAGDQCVARVAGARLRN